MNPIGMGSCAWVALAAVLAGCTTAPMIPEPFYRPAQARDAAGREGGVPGDAVQGEKASEARETAIYKTPPIPQEKVVAGRKPPSPTAPPADGGKPLEATLSLENLPLPQFINTVFAGVLKQNVSVDPQVAARNDMVSLRTGKPQTAGQLSAAAKAVLRSYGVAISEFDGVVRAVPDNAQSGVLPEIRRGRASPDVPDALRPVFHIVELSHTSLQIASSWLRVLFPNRLNTYEDAGRNTLMLSGQSDTVAAALETLQLLDQPMMRGRRSARMVPVYWPADELSRKLSDLLTAEGYFVGQNAAAQAPLLIIPVPPINSLVIFSSNQQTLDHALRWARELDQPNKARSQSGGYVTYFARNVDAADLARTVSDLLGGGAVAPASPSGAAGASSGARSSRVVVNAAANSLIIQASATEFQQLRGLLEELDRPARSALVMATVAEVTLDSTETFNFNWVLKQFAKGGYNYKLGTTAGGALASAASNFSILLSGPAGDPRAVLSALASDNKVKILSNPSVMARSGEVATIQVGTQVPIITSQVSNANTGFVGGSTGILQTVQYVQTGVILKVKPVVHAGGRIDLEVSQEVSSAATNNTGGTTSPVISNKKVDTKLSVTDGNTVLMGGLISEERSHGTTGIPWVKDIPVVGGLFQTSNTSDMKRTELVVMLTSYAVEDDFDARSITDAFRSQFAWAAAAPVTKLAAPKGSAGGMNDAGDASEAVVAPASAAPSDDSQAQAAAQAIVEPAPSTGKSVVKVDAPAQPTSRPALTNSARRPSAAPKAQSPAATAAPAESRVKGEPYALPDQDPPEPASPAPSAPEPSTVAPAQHSAVAPTHAGDTSLSPRPIMIDSPSVAAAKAPLPRGTGKQVTDESLRQELMKAIRGDAGAMKP